MKHLRIFTLALFISSAVAVGAQADPTTVAKIVDEGKNHNKVMEHLKYLSKKIGARLSTSENLDKAYAWTVKKFKEVGCQNVHLEEWGEWPVGFQRGKSSGKMVSPEKVNFEFTTQSWSEGTHGKKKGPAIYAPDNMEQFIAMKDKLKGAWLIYKTGGFRGGPRRQRPGDPPPELTPEQKAAQDLREAINGAGILGSVSPAGGDLVITSGNYRDKTFEQHPTDVNITVRKSDMAKIVADMDANKPVVLEFDVNQKWIKGPRKLFNVVAEIPGTEKPDEVVIVGGHLDSWDGPGSEGSQDNGTGSMCAIEAARILGKVGAKPKRTIRFVLFTAEEQGLFGSRAYVEKHKDEWPKISAVFIEDNGANYESGTYALEAMVPYIQPIIDTTNAAFPDCQMKIRTVQRIPRGGGSDHMSFNAVGVPAFFWDKSGPMDYNYIHHTQYDNYEQIKPEYMVQCSTNEAVAVYITACQPNMMPRDTPPATNGGGP